MISCYSQACQKPEISYHTDTVILEDSEDMKMLGVYSGQAKSEEIARDGDVNGDVNGDDQAGTLVDNEVKQSPLGKDRCLFRICEYCGTSYFMLF